MGLLPAGKHLPGFSLITTKVLPDINPEILCVHIKQHYIFITKMKQWALHSDGAFLLLTLTLQLKLVRTLPSS